jgi:hypothetical protein
MNWIAASVIVLGAVLWYAKAAKRAVARKTGATGPVPAGPKGKPPAAKRPPREPEVVQTPPPEETLEAVIASDRPDAMQAALGRTDDPWQRHQLYSALVEKAYKQRQHTAERVAVLTHGRQYIDEFERIAPVLRAKSSGEPVLAPVFKMMAITLDENQDFDEAIDVCQKALQWDLDDGTKTGFKGRMARIRKKMNR